VEAGIAPGMTILDVGCGVGDVAFLAAELVGPSGAVVGIDRAPQAITIARSREQERPISTVSFRENDLSALTFGRQFDAVVGRYVLMYLRDPSAVLRLLASFVRSGGVIVFHELHLPPFQFVSYPAAPLYDRCCHWVTEFFRRGGHDERMGIKLHQAFVDAGLPAPTMRMETIIGGDARGMMQVDQLAAFCVAQAAEFERLGIATAEEIGVDTLAERLRQDVAARGSIVLRCNAEIGAWARVE
jgi:SAM-dependent methyltransferase